MPYYIRRTFFDNYRMFTSEKPFTFDLAKLREFAEHAGLEVNEEATKHFNAPSRYYKKAVTLFCTKGRNSYELNENLLDGTGSLSEEFIAWAEKAHGLVLLEKNIHGLPTETIKALG